MSFISYAQNNEDVLLHRVFGGQETGFYVDIGAYHPIEGSVTKAFYDRGWAGINIEPGPVFDELAAARSRDVNLRMVALDHTGTAILQENAFDPGMSRVVNGSDAIAGTREVACDTLENIVRLHGNGRPVDFLKVDAEGAEASIASSTNWRRFRPRVLVFEATLPWSNVLSNTDWEPVLLSGGYVRVYFDGINCFYVPEEELPILERHFRVPVNVLDRVEQYDATSLAAREEMRRTLAESEGALAECSVARTAAEAARDLARAEQHAAELQSVLLTNRHAAKEERLRVEHAAVENGLRAEIAAAQEGRRAAEASLAALEAERARLAAVCDQVTSQIASAPESHEALAAALQSVQVRDSAPSSGPPLAPPYLSARWLARFAYGLVRPVVRPVMHRFRTFMTAPQLQAVGALHDNMLRINELLRIRAAPGDLAEMRRLAAEVEKAVLTLAMEAATSIPIARASYTVQPEPRPALARVPLLLPDGRRTKVECVKADLSVGAALAKSGGDWEPHVRMFLNARVGPVWTCLDVGANIGAHTLSLATLACEGRVIAFEADPANYALLRQNTDALQPPRARVETVNLALWDSETTLQVGGAEELSGCSFVATGEADETGTERALRKVADAFGIADTPLHVRLTEVRAVRLDDWAEEHGLDRLDLIKLDVEGAEASVIRGADATLRRLQPILLVEYNSSCAAAYFGQSPEALFRELEWRFNTIHALNLDGSLVRLPGWDALQARLKSGKGKEILICLEARANSEQDSQLAENSRSTAYHS